MFHFYWCCCSACGLDLYFVKIPRKQRSTSSLRHSCQVTFPSRPITSLCSFYPTSAHESCCGCRFRHGRGAPVCWAISFHAFDAEGRAYAIYTELRKTAARKTRQSATLLMLTSHMHRDTQGWHGLAWSFLKSICVHFLGSARMGAVYLHTRGRKG